MPVTTGAAPRGRRRLVARSVWWCLHSLAYAPDGFHPNDTGESADPTGGGRFNPFADVAGVRVPTKYLADHPNGAFAETLFRDDALERRLARETVASRRLVQLALRRDLLVADLAEPEPGSALAKDLGSGAAAYPRLRRLAASLHATDPGLAGLLWQGRQLDQPGMACIVLFGDRVAGDGGGDGGADDGLELVQSLELERGTGLAMLRAAARLRGVALPAALAGGGR